LKLPASAAQQLDRQLGGVVSAVQHAGAEHENRVVERLSLAFLDRVELAGDVRQLFEKRLIDLQVIGVVSVRQLMMANLDTLMRELQIAVILIEFQRANTRGVGLESQHEDVAH